VCFYLILYAQWFYLVHVLNFVEINHLLICFVDIVWTTNEFYASFWVFGEKILGQAWPRYNPRGIGSWIGSPAWPPKSPVKTGSATDRFGHNRRCNRCSTGIIGLGVGPTETQPMRLSHFSTLHFSWILLEFCPNHIFFGLWKPYACIFPICLYLCLACFLWSNI
jgi:hypothetical protein